MKTRRTQITKIGRLLKRADFLRVQGLGQKWVTPTCIVQMAHSITPHPNPTMSASIFPSKGEELPSCLTSPFVCRYGLTITKKIWKHAVDRNRVRRRVRAVFLGVLAARMAMGQIPSGADFVILPRLPALSADISAIEKDLSWALKRLIKVEEEKN